MWKFNREQALGSNPVVFKWSTALVGQALIQTKLILELILTIRYDRIETLLDRKENKLVEVSNGWAEVSIEQLKTDKEYTLEIKAGTPSKPLGLDPQDVRADRKGFFSTISRALGAHVSSQLNVHVRTLAKLEKAKQVQLGQKRIR